MDRRKAKRQTLLPIIKQIMTCFFQYNSLELTTYFGFCKVSQNSPEDNFLNLYPYMVGARQVLLF